MTTRPARLNTGRHIFGGIKGRAIVSEDPLIAAGAFEGQIARQGPRRRPIAVDDQVSPGFLATVDEANIHGA